MKKTLKYLVTKLLVMRARRVLKKNRVQVIAVTGSIAKTSTKDAIYTVLKDHFSVHRSTKGFNTELGVALAVLQEEESGFSSAKAWLKILGRSLSAPKKPYQKIILEMGADHPGDIKRLVNIAKPHIAVITHVAPVHLDEGQFHDVQEIANEKENLIKFLKPADVAILNHDNPWIRQMQTKAKRVSYGVENPDVTLNASGVKVSTRNIKFTVRTGKETHGFTVPVLGEFQTYTFLPAIAVGLELGMTLTECETALQNYRLPPGRMSVIDGINKTTILDSSYNASPSSVMAALGLMKDLKGGRKVIALGTMNELGDMAKEAHLNAGKAAALAADILVMVGPEAATLKQGALENNFPENQIYTFLDSEEAGHFIKTILEPKDIVLVKGSQNRVRMEKLVKIIMAEPERAKELLCRQEEAWSNM